MDRIAIPVFKSRVSPVFDSCTRLLLVDLDQNQEVARTEILMEGLSEIERLNVLKKATVCKVICGGISDGFYNMISQAEISVITGIAGEVNQVMSAFRSNRLGEPCFYMPGYKNPQN